VSSHSVRISAGVPLDVPRELAAPVLEAVLRRFESEAPGLSIDLARDLQIPVEASVEVPVKVSLLTVRPPASYEIRLEAAEQRGYYPAFAGVLSIVTAGASRSTLELDGTYAVPLGALGEMLDMTLLAGAAESSLMRFLRRLSAETAGAVRDEQAEHARAAMHFHV
jgi:hypothetical protein